MQGSLPRVGIALTSPNPIQQMCPPACCARCPPAMPPVRSPHPTPSSSYRPPQQSPRAPPQAPQISAPAAARHPGQRRCPCRRHRTRPAAVAGGAARHAAAGQRCRHVLHLLRATGTACAAPQHAAAWPSRAFITASTFIPCQRILPRPLLAPTLKVKPIIPPAVRSSPACHFSAICMHARAGGAREGGGRWARALPLPHIGRGVAWGQGHHGVGSAARGFNRRSSGGRRAKASCRAAEQ